MGLPVIRPQKSVCKQKERPYIYTHILEARAGARRAVRARSSLQLLNSRRASMPSAMRRAFWLACAVLCSGAPRPLHAAASVREQPNPHDAFASFDCALRQLALEFASHLQPHRSRPELQAIADALNNDTYATCRNLTVPGNPPPLSSCIPDPIRRDGDLRRSEWE